MPFLPLKGIKYPCFLHLQAFSVYYYVMKAFNLTDTRDSFSLQAYDDAMYSWCNKTWEDVSHKTGFKRTFFFHFIMLIIYLVLLKK